MCVNQGAGHSSCKFFSDTAPNNPPEHLTDIHPRNCPVPVTSLGGRPPRVTSSRGWHPDESKKNAAEFTKSTGKTISWKAGRGWEWWRLPKNVIHFEDDDQKRVVSFFEERNRATPSVTAPGDTTPSDATTKYVFTIIRGVAMILHWGPQ